MENGPLQIVFEVDVEHESNRVLDFYRDWAENQGWSLVDPDEEDWGTAEWSSFFDTQGRRVSQLLAHFADSRKEWSLRMTLRHLGLREKQVVILQLSSYHLIPKTETGLTLDDFLPDG